jgi:hypothetical protein
VVDESKDVLFVLEKVGHEGGEEGFYTLSVANEEDLNGEGRVISTQYAIHIKVERRKYRCPRLYLFSRFHARVRLLVRKKRCPFAPQQYHERLINSRPWVLCNDTRDHTKAQRIK